MDYKDTLGEIHKYMSNMDYKHAKNCIATFLVNTKIADLSYDDLSSLFCDSVTIGATSSIIVCMKRLNKDCIRGYSSTRIGNLVVNLLTEDATPDISIESMASLTDYEKSVMYYIRYMTFKNIEDLNRSYNYNNFNISAVYELYSRNESVSLESLALLFATKDIQVNCNKTNKNKKLHLEILGGGDEVGRSCYAIRTLEGSVIVDCGAKIEGDRLTYPDFENHMDIVKDAKVCIITHSHLDHCGGMFELYKRNKNIRFMMSEATLVYLKYNFDNYEYKDTIEFRSMLNRVIIVSEGNTINLSEDTKLHFYKAGHILGALSVMIETGGIKALFTGDYSIDSFNTVGGMEIPDLKVDYLISEHTYSNSEFSNSRQTQRTEFRNYIVSKLREGKSILIPAFTIGRTQEVISILNEISEDDIDNIFVDGSSVGATEDYIALTHKYLKYVERYVTIDKESFIKNNFLHGKNCMVCSSGMLHEGSTSFEYFKSLATNPKCTIVITGYQGEGTVGRELLRAHKCHKEYLDIGKLIQLKCDIQDYGLSAHCFNNEILALVHKVQPSNIIFIHGDDDCSRLCQRIKNCNIIVGSNTNYDI